MIVKPGWILGKREEASVLGALVGGLAEGLGAVSGGWLKGGWAQDAAVAAGFKVLDKDSGTPKVRFVKQADVVRLGRTERKA